MNRVLRERKSGVGRPFVRIVLARAADQALVAVAEIEAEAAPDGVVIVLADTALGEGGYRRPIAEMEEMLGSRRRGVETGGVAVADEDAGVIVDEIGDVGLVEEAAADVELSETVVEKAAMTEFGAGDGPQGEAVEIGFAFGRGMADIGVSPAAQMLVIAGLAKLVNPFHQCNVWPSLEVTLSKSKRARRASSRVTPICFASLPRRGRPG